MCEISVKLMMHHCVPEGCRKLGGRGGRKVQSSKGKSSDVALPKKDLLLEKSSK